MRFIKWIVGLALVFWQCQAMAASKGSPVVDATTGALLAPTNFFTGNSNLLYQAVSGMGLGGSSTGGVDAATSLAISIAVTDTNAVSSNNVALISAKAAQNATNSIAAESLTGTLSLDRIASDAINSNKLDMATRALLGTGTGGTPGAITNGHTVPVTLQSTLDWYARPNFGEAFRFVYKRLMASNPIVVVGLGDSMIRYVNIVGKATHMANMMQDAFGVRGYGLEAMQTTLTNGTPTFHVRDDFDNWFTGSYYTLTPNSALRFSKWDGTSVSANQATLYYKQEAGAGTLSVSTWNGSSYVSLGSVSADGATTGAAVNFSCTNGAYQLSVTNASAANVVLYGVALRDTNCVGVEYHILAYPGIAATSAALVPTNLISPILSAIGPHLVMSDWWEGYTNGLETALLSIRSKFLGTNDWLYFVPTPAGGDTTGDDECRIVMKLAQDTKSAWVDSRRYLSSTNVLEQLSWFGDITHLHSDAQRYCAIRAADDLGLSSFIADSIKGAFHVDRTNVSVAYRLGVGVSNPQSTLDVVDNTGPFPVLVRGSGSRVGLNIDATASGNGNPLIAFSLNQNGTAVMGLDDADADTFKITLGTPGSVGNFGAADRIRITTSEVQVTNASLRVYGGQTNSGTISASAFVGDGSGLTGLTSGSSSNAVSNTNGVAVNLTNSPASAGGDMLTWHDGLWAYKVKVAAPYLQFDTPNSGGRYQWGITNGPAIMTLDPEFGVTSLPGFRLGVGGLLQSASGQVGVSGGMSISGNLQFSSENYAGLELNALTSTERDALETEGAGHIFWNSTLSKIQVATALDTFQTVLTEENYSAPATPAIADVLVAGSDADGNDLTGLNRLGVDGLASFAGGINSTGGPTVFGATTISGGIQQTNTAQTNLLAGWTVANLGGSTNLPASAITGQMPNARFGAAITNVDMWVQDAILIGGDAVSIEVNDDAGAIIFSGSAPLGSGANWTNLNASSLASGTVSLARLPYTPQPGNLLLSNYVSSAGTAAYVSGVLSNSINATAGVTSVGATNYGATYSSWINVTNSFTFTGTNTTVFVWGTNTVITLPAATNSAGRIVSVMVCSLYATGNKVTNGTGALDIHGAADYLLGAVNTATNSFTSSANGYNWP